MGVLAASVPASARAPVAHGPASARAFFVGASILGGAYGGHTIVMEVFEAMHGAKSFMIAFLLGQIAVLGITLPPTLGGVTAFWAGLAKVDTIYGVLPRSSAMAVSVWLMNMHQLVLFGLICMPLYYYAERLWGVHGNGWFAARLAARLPVCTCSLCWGGGRGVAGTSGAWRLRGLLFSNPLPIHPPTRPPPTPNPLSALLVWLLSVAFPFMAAVNALLNAVAGPALAFVLPCAGYNWAYRTEEARRTAPFPPPRPRWLSAEAAWQVAFVGNAVVGTAMAAFGIGAVWFSVASIGTSVSGAGAFPECYQCVAPPKVG